ncbi:hypothetical protein VTH82DRAFT_5058 [Thermothelomyces myriococcoides]
MDSVTGLASTIGNRFVTNLKGSFADMTPQQFIRLVIIVGTYLLLRPYLVKLGARAQMKAHEAEEARSEAAAKAKMSANELRGRVQVPDDTDDEDEGSQASGPDWGKRARRRQREMIKKLLAAEEQRLRESQEELEDKDIEEFLVKE